MLCPQDGSESKVIDSRERSDRGVRRRRECLACGHRWTTYERDFGIRSSPTELSNAKIAKAIAACESAIEHLTSLLANEGDIEKE